MDRPIIDSRGRPCPLPIIDLARALPEVQIGAAVVLLADDPGAHADVPAWCRMRGQVLEEVVTHHDHAAFVVRRVS